MHACLKLNKGKSDLKLQSVFTKIFIILFTGFNRVFTQQKSAWSQQISQVSKVKKDIDYKILLNKKALILSWLYTRINRKIIFI